MKIQVIGSGCATCKKLHEITQKAVLEMGRDEIVEYSTDISKIIEMGVMQSPVLVVNDKPVMAGFTSDIKKLQKAICSVIKKDEKNTKCGCGKDCC